MAGEISPEESFGGCYTSVSNRVTDSIAGLTEENVAVAIQAATWPLNNVTLATNQPSHVFVVFHKLTPARCNKTSFCCHESNSRCLQMNYQLMALS
jgi:hypothetical protein